MTAEQASSAPFSSSERRTAEPAAHSALGYAVLQQRRSTHAAWKLLAADHAPLVIGFLAAAYLEPNVRLMAEPELVERLEEYLERCRNHEPDAYPKPPIAYLANWATAGWLRRSFPTGTDIAHYEPTSAVELAAQFCRTLAPREFVGTASRLLVIHDLLRKISVGGAEDPQIRIDELLRQREAIDVQVDAIRDGQDTRMEDAALRDSFGLIVDNSRGLLSDLRAVEASMRDLDRDVRKRAAVWDGPRGEFLATVFGSADSIDNSDQGRTWQAFWQHLLNAHAQDELAALLDAVGRLPALHGRTDEVHRLLSLDLFHAADGTQRTVAGLSGQLRRFVDDQAWTESRRISVLLREFFAAALAVRDDDTRHLSTHIPGLRAEIRMPLERPLYTTKEAVALDEVTADVGDTSGLDLAEIAALQGVDLTRLHTAIDSTLAAHGGYTTLGEVLTDHPLQDGLAELVSYFDVATTRTTSSDLDRTESVVWTGTDDITRSTEVPMIVFRADREDST